ncbi:MAG: winged helix-turn-helix transcriptional regulator [Bacillota bacterium]
MIEFNNKKYNCLTEFTLDVINGKWRVLIIWYLRNNVMRFGELRKIIPGITPKMLRQQLKELEDFDIVRREVFPQVPPRVEYSLTESGKTLYPVLDLMYDWAFKHISSNKEANEEDMKEGSDKLA